jgi:mono/diheme cytochrome c family protein
MKHNLTYRKLVTIVCGLAFISLVSCDRDNNSTGYVYMPDMTYSRAYESYSTNPNFADDLTMREPVDGTVPRGYTPLPYTKDPLDRIKAGVELKNPYESNIENLARGEVLYNRNCIHCHGSKGDGQGNLYTSGLFPFPPASLVNEKVRNLPDGEIFHTITYGIGVMGSQSSSVQFNDRWKIILYIRKELQK